jgi:hypothetical protein
MKNDKASINEVLNVKAAEAGMRTISFKST